MFTNRRLIFALALVFAPVVLTAPAQATQIYHAWVSNTGNDSASCDITAPCATFAGAYSKTAADGEITCLTSGDFGALPITKSITVDCQNSIGSSATGASIGPFNITAPAGSVITLRGLDFDFLGTSIGCGAEGPVTFTGGGVLHLQKMKINHANLDSCNGVWFAPTSTATLDITDSDITDNGASGSGAGVYIQPQSGVQANVTVTRTQIQGNYFGIFGDGRSGGTIRATIKDSVVSGNIENGITAVSSGASVVFMVDQTEVSGNLAGMFAGGSNAGMLARNTTVFNNTVGLDTTGGGTLYTYGNNSVNGNTTNGAFTGTAALQ